jgi:hypothetical protein
MLVVFVGLVLIKIAWRASLTIFVALAVDFIGMFGAVVPPVVLPNQVFGHALVGALLGAIICTGREREEIRRLPWLAAAVLLMLTARWAGSFADLAASLWLFAVRMFVLPAAMYVVIILAQRHLAARDVASRGST